MSDSPYYKELALDALHIVQSGDEEAIKEEEMKIQVEYNCQEISEFERDKLLSILSYEFAQ